MLGNDILARLKSRTAGYDCPQCLHLFGRDNVMASQIEEQFFDQVTSLSSATADMGQAFVSNRGGTSGPVRALGRKLGDHVMPRYYFDLHNGDGPTTDFDGLDLTSRDMLTREITRILLDVARDEMPRENRAIVSLKVRDENGKIISVASLTFNTEWLE